jgi:RNA polymerase sigma-70 factor (ECF subfamily)
MDTVTSEISSWVKLYTNEMYHYTVLKVTNKETAEDIVQNTFLAAIESYPKFKHQSNSKTWLYAILKNKIADYLRHKYKESSTIQPMDPLNICFDENGTWRDCHRPIDWHNEEQLLDNPQFNSILKNCFENLPQKWSSAVQLKYFYEHNSKVICNDLNITPANFWQMIHRAKVMLRFCLETNWFKNQNAN